MLGSWRRRRGARRLARSGGPEAVGSLVDTVVSSRDAGAVTAAERALADLTDQAAIDAVCEAAIDRDHARVRDLVRSAGYRHSDLALRAATVFVVEDDETYDSLDHDGSLLRAAHAGAGASRRARLAAHARSSGRTQWVQAVLRTPATAELSDSEWDAAIDVAAGARRWDQLWAWTTDAPPRCALRILQTLDEQGWQPDGLADRAGLSEMVRRVRDLPPSLAEGFSPAEHIALTCSSDVGQVRVTADGSTVCVGVEGGIHIWSLPSGEPAGVIRGGRSIGRCLEVSADSRFVVSDRREHRTFHEGHAIYQDGQLGLWRLPSGEPAGTLTGERHHIQCLALSPDGALAAAGDDHGNVHIWELPSGRAVTHQHVSDSPLIHLSALPDGNNTLLCVDGGRGLTVLDLASGRPIGRLSGRPPSVDKILSTPDGQFLVGCSTSYGLVYLWDPASGRQLATLTEENDAWDIAMSSDGRFVVVGEFRRIRMFALPSGKSLGTIGAGTGATAVAVIPGEDLIAGEGGDGDVRLWHPDSGELVATLTGGGHLINHLTTTPDGSAVIASGLSAQVDVWRLWRPETRALSGRALRDVGTAEVADLKHSLQPGLPSEGAWLDLVDALLRWRHRHDVELDDTTDQAAGDTDIEL